MPTEIIKQPEQNNRIRER